MRPVFMHERLRVYQVGAALYPELARLTAAVGWLHRHLVIQLLRAVSSSCLNLAEGCHEYSRPDKRRFFRMALRSAGEAAAALDLLCRAGAVDPTEALPAFESLNQLIAMLTQLSKK